MNLLAIDDLQRSFLAAVVAQVHAIADDERLMQPRDLRLGVRLRRRRLVADEPEVAHVAAASVGSLRSNACSTRVTRQPAAVPFKYAMPVAQSHWNLCVSRSPRSDSGRDETPVSAIVVRNCGAAGSVTSSTS